MYKTRIILIISAATLVAVLFLLPKVVVDNDQKTLGVENSVEEDHSGHDHAPGEGHGNTSFTHGESIAPEDATSIEDLQKFIASNTFNEKSVIFADSLAKLFQKYNKLDSASKYIGMIAENFPNEENIEAAGLAYYEAFSFATDASRKRELGEQALGILSEILDKNPERLDIKTKVALTTIAVKAPMQGVLMLRSVVEEDPNNVEAIFNLGVLSRQSNQLDKAIGRFEQLLEIDPQNIQGRLLYAVTLMDLSRNEDAKVQLEKIKELDNTPELVKVVDGYLQNIN